MQQPVMSCRFSSYIRVGLWRGIALHPADSPSSLLLVRSKQLHSICRRQFVLMRASTTTTPVRRTRQLLDHLHQSTTMSSSPSAAPWRSAFLSHIQEMQPPSFVLSTIHALETSPNSAIQLVPRARTVIFRGMWASLPANHRNPAERNPDLYISDMPAITTDVRMEKIPELLGREDSEQSGIGGPIEAVFWAEKQQTQWRIRGRVCVVGPDIESDAAAPVRAALQFWMRSTSTDESGTWSWTRELTAHFGNLSPLMRGSFKNPTPGRPLTEKPEPGMVLGQVVEDLHDEVARKNFRVLVIMPEEVDRVDLMDSNRGKRWNYKVEATESGSSWTTTELWP